MNCLKSDTKLLSVGRAGEGYDSPSTPAEKKKPAQIVIKEAIIHNIVNNTLLNLPFLTLPNLCANGFLKRLLLHSIKAHLLTYGFVTRCRRCRSWSPSEQMIAALNNRLLLSLKNTMPHHGCTSACCHCKVMKDKEGAYCYGHADKCRCFAELFALLGNIFMDFIF